MKEQADQGPRKSSAFDRFISVVIVAVLVVLVAWRIGPFLLFRFLAWWI